MTGLAGGAIDLTPVEQRRFEAKINKTDSCWLWIGGKQAAGYGSFGVRGSGKLAHRVSYELHRGAIPDGLHLDHLCRVKSCVNPDHLEPVTPRENVRRAAPYRVKSQHGSRSKYVMGCRCDLCRDAAAASVREYRAKKKLEAHLDAIMLQLLDEHLTAEG